MSPSRSRPQRPPRHQVSSVPIAAGRGGTGRTIGTTYARGRTGLAVMCGEGLAVMAGMEGSFLLLLAASPYAIAVGSPRCGGHLRVARWRLAGKPLERGDPRPWGSGPPTSARHGQHPSAWRLSADWQWLSSGPT